MSRTAFESRNLGVRCLGTALEKRRQGAALPKGRTPKRLYRLVDVDPVNLQPFHRSHRPGSGMFSKPAS